MNIGVLEESLILQMLLHLCRTKGDYHGNIVKAGYYNKDTARKALLKIIKLKMAYTELIEGRRGLMKMYYLTPKGEEIAKHLQKIEDVLGKNLKA